VPARSVKELLALAKAQPGRLTFASTGNGTVNHVAGELLNSMAGIRTTHVPYKGTGPMMLDLLAGHIDLGYPGVASVVPHINAGRLQALAVTGATRSLALPAVPTVAEAALPGYEATSFWGILAPAKTPPDIVRRLNTAVIDALKNAELRDSFTRQGNELTPGTPEAFAALIRADTAKWARVVKSAGIKLDP
jgi:tripartite-type tricarboxylate transporter receptor subunit TctC